LRSHPEQTTSPPLMVRASPAPGRTAEGRAGALPTQPTPAGSAATRTWLSRGAAGTDGTRGLHCALGVRVRPSPARVRGREQKRAASPRPTPRGRGSCRAEGARAFQCARLADRRAVPPAASAALGLSENSAPARSRASVPCAPPPWNRTSPGAFRNRHYVARARTHSLSLSLSRTHTHTHTLTQCPRARRPPRLASWFRGAGRDPLLPLPRERVGHFPAAPGKRRGADRGKRGTARVSCGRRAGPGPRREPLGWRRNAERRWAAGAGQGASPAGGWVRSRSRRRGRGAAEERGTRLLGSGDRPHCPVPSRSSRAASPTAGRAAG